MCLTDVNPKSDQIVVIFVLYLWHRKLNLMQEYKSLRAAVRDCNPGLEFSIPGFGIIKFAIPGSRDPVGIGVE